MKITVLTGSPRKNGTSNYMADEFIRGAKENGLIKRIGADKNGHWLIM